MLSEHVNEIHQTAVPVKYDDEVVGVADVFTERIVDEGLPVYLKMTIEATIYSSYSRELFEKMTDDLSISIHPFRRKHDNGGSHT